MEKETQRFQTKIIGKASILDKVFINLDKQAKALKQKSFEERGRFPLSILSQPDTLALQCVILTTGRPGNLNDDVLLNSEILPVLWTASLKPFNIEHTKFIVGCMFDAFAINKETGETVPGIEKYSEDKTDEDRENDKKELEKIISNLPENLDIITNQVLWSAHFPKEVAMIKRKAIAGELFVSMEVWFTDYDYLLGNRIIKRTPEIAEILDKYLKMKGGGGVFGVDRIRRIPRNLTFAGNAAVETPANPDSFILDVKDKHDMEDEKEMMDYDDSEDEYEVNASIIELINSNTISILQSLSDNGEASKLKSIVSVGGGTVERMGTEANEFAIAKTEVGEVVTVSEVNNMAFDEKRFVEVLEANAVLKNDNDKMTAVLADVNKEKEDLKAKNAELEARLEESLSLIKDKETALAAKVEAFEKLEADKVAIAKKLDEASVRLTEIEEQRKLVTRKAAIAELSLSQERSVKLLAKTSEFTDEAFANEIADLKALMAEMVPVKAKEPVVVVKIEEVEASEEELDEALEETEEELSPVAAAVGTVSVDADTDVKQIQSAMAKALGINLKV